MSSPDVLVAGSNIAGLTMARELAGRGLEVEVVVGGKRPDTSQLELDNRIQVPVAKIGVWKDLLEDSYDTTTPVIERFGFTVGNHEVDERITRRVSAREGLNNTAALDIVEARHALLDDLNGSDRIVFTEGRVDGVEVADGQVQSVSVNDERRTPVLTIDATGKMARVLAMIEKAAPGSVETRKKKGQNTYLGGYVDPGELPETGPFANAHEVGTIGVQPTGIRSLVAPTQEIEGSQASHLLIVSGPDKVIDATRDIEHPDDPSETGEFVARIRALCGEGTMWDEIIRSIVYADRFCSHQFGGGQLREVRISGIIPAGDARRHTDPAAGHGLEQIRDDVKALGIAIAANRNDLRAAGDSYNALRGPARKDLAKTARIARTFIILGDATKKYYQAASLARQAKALVTK